MYTMKDHPLLLYWLQIMYQIGQTQNEQINIINQIQMKATPSTISYDHVPLQNCRVYTLHKAIKNDENCFVKVFNNQVLQKYSLTSTILFNIQVLCQNFDDMVYSENILKIENTCNINDAMMILTKSYTCRLDQYIQKNGPLQQYQALKIFEDILKAIFSVVKCGYWHRNLRAEHFVRVNNKWKLQSLVQLNQIAPAAQGISTEYLRKVQYQPPQAYSSQQFTEQEIQQRIVWDLGCILIHLLLGSNKLKSLDIINKFKNQPFSFEKIGANVAIKFSKQLKNLLGQMCHYNKQSRIKFKDLLLNGFFSKQIAQKISPKQQANKQNNEKEQKKPQKIQPPKGLQKSARDLLKQDQKDQLNLSSQGVHTREQFSRKIQQMINEYKKQDGNPNIEQKQKIKKLPSLQELDDDQHHDIIEVIKNYLDKGEILGIGARKFKQLINLHNNQEKAKELIDLTLFSVQFVKCIDLHKLAKSMNENKPIFRFNEQKWQAFIDTPEYFVLKRLVNFRKTEAIKQLQRLKQIIQYNDNSFVKQKQIIQGFVKSRPQKCQFHDIKQAYRRILKLSYDIVANHYTNNKSEKLARLGMYLTYCLAIDKFYIPEEFQANFQFFFRWAKKKPCNYVSLQQFQNFLQHAPKKDLMDNSNYIMERYYES